MALLGDVDVVVVLLLGVVVDFVVVSLFEKLPLLITVALLGVVGFVVVLLLGAVADFVVALLFEKLPLLELVLCEELE